MKTEYSRRNFIYLMTGIVYRVASGSCRLCFKPRFPFTAHPQCQAEEGSRGRRVSMTIRPLALLLCFSVSLWLTWHSGRTNGSWRQYDLPLTPALTSPDSRPAQVSPSGCSTCGCCCPSPGPRACLFLQERCAAC